jgi:diguanylate cyclase (GGDEF)-like protein
LIFTQIAQKIRAWLSTADLSERGTNQNLSSSDISPFSLILTSLAIAGAVIGLRQTGILQQPELIVFDSMVRSQPPSPPDPRLLIVKITEEDIRNQKKWPLSDRVVAQLLETLQKQQPKVIGLDLYRDLAQPPGEKELSEQLKANNVITITKLQGNDGQSVPPPPNVPKERVGFSDFVLDSDNILRRNLMYADLSNQQVYSLALQVSLNYLNDRNLAFQVTPEALKIGNATFTRLTKNSGGYQMLPSEALGWQTLIQYRSPQEIARHVTLTEVLNGKVDPGLIKDKAVLIGTIAPSLKDFVATPYSAKETDSYLMPGVVIHGQIVSQILNIVLDNQRPFWYWSQWTEWGWIWVWSLVGGLLGWRLNHPLSVGVGIAIATSGLWGIGYVIFFQSGWIPVVPNAIGLLVTSVGMFAYRLFFSIYHDSLTGLPNRRLFLKQLQKINRQNKSQNALVAVLFLDLDRFKRINDGLGREAGDWLLLNTAKRLQNRLARKGTLARVAGDEFAIYLTAIADVEEAAQLADCLQKELAHPFQWQGQDIYTTICIGIAYNRTGNDFDAEELIREADIAMYQAKESGQARHQIFAAGMRTQAQTRWQLETELRSAIERQEFQLYYQPIVSLKTLKVTGFEALVRWQSPQRGFVSPGVFVPLAEETGLIIPLGQWILQEACLQINRWREQFPEHSSLMMSVNLSQRQFTQVDLVKQIQLILEEIGVDRNRLKLEITESHMMTDVEKGLALLQQLKTLGLKLSLDDFGTGYSSLSNLHTFPIDTLKIDQSFVNRLSESQESHKYAQIVRTIIMLGHNLEFDVIAEGVETAHQVRALQSLECEYGQGYFFSKPLPNEAATELLTNNPQWSV